MMKPDMLPRPKDAITFWVIYQHPEDYPQGYVLRPQFVLSGGQVQLSQIAWLSLDPQTLRDLMPPGAITLPTTAGEDPVILETWME